MTSHEDFDALLADPESYRLECKAARNHYDFDRLVEYCVALANEGGGTMLLGVTDERPREVVGTSTFPDPGRTELEIYQRTGQRVSIEEYTSPPGLRVLIVRIPSRRPGVAVNDRGRYWMRAGEALVPMSEDLLQAIHAETDTDFSAEVVPGASIADLDSSTIAEFRRRWTNRDNNPRIAGWSDEGVLSNAELLRDGSITYAALILFGTKEAVATFAPQSETIFEYRATEEAGPAQDRVEFREGFLLYEQQLWERVNLRNDQQSFQDGLFRTQIPTFDEGTIREGILNGICHRDYRQGGPVIVRQYPRRLEITSPGGFPPGVTADNILDQQNPRNRRLAEALARCGLIERAGQGLNLMVERSVRQSKPLPDFTGTGPHLVKLTLRGNVTNTAFVRFLERLGAETLASFDTRDLLVLDYLQRDEQLTQDLRLRLPRLIRAGAVESIGRGRGARYFLSRRLYEALGQRGTYTRRRGLDHQTNRELVLRHIRSSAKSGCSMSELEQVLPSLSRPQLKRLLDELRRERLVRLKGVRRWARWFPSEPTPMDSPHASDPNGDP